MLRERRYIIDWTQRIRSWFILKSNLGRTRYIHFQICPQFYIMKVKTNCHSVQRLIGSQDSLIFYRILDFKKHVSLPQLLYYLKYKFPDRDLPVHLNFGKYLLSTQGRLAIEKENYILKLRINSVLHSNRENYFDTTPHHRHLGNEIYRYLVEEVSKENLNIRDLLTKFPSSRSNLFQIFKRVVGVSPNTVRRDNRIFRFQNKLLETDHSVYTLFLESGFKSRGHLYGLFQEIYGMSPVMFRRTYRNKTEINK